MGLHNKKEKPYKERDSEKIHGKIGYRKRKMAEEEARKELLSLPLIDTFNKWKVENL